MGIASISIPPSRSLLADRFFERQYSSLAGCLGIIKNTFGAQGVRVHTADRMPAPNGSDIHLYVSIGNLANYRTLSDRPDVVLSAFMVTESPVVDPRMFAASKHAKHYFKRIFSCVDELSSRITPELMSTVRRCAGRSIIGA